MLLYILALRCTQIWYIATTYISLNRVAIILLSSSLWAPTRNTHTKRSQLDLTRYQQLKPNPTSERTFKTQVVSNLNCVSTKQSNTNITNITCFKSLSQVDCLFRIANQQMWIFGNERIMPNQFPWNYFFMLDSNFIPSKRISVGTRQRNYPLH